MLCVWCRAGFERQAVPLAVYGVQLLLNFLWTPLFFKVHRLDLASADIAGGCPQP
jgi:tryptophan-rich sensory protein